VAVPEVDRARAVELAHAVLMPGFGGHVVPPWLARALESGLGGVCYFGHNVDGPAQVARLSAAVHDLGPAVIAVDEEGGIVTRLHASHGSPHVGNAVLGRVDDLAVTRQVARDIAGQLRRAGIDVDLAPVVDVNANPHNPVIGVRSFGADPELVARHGAAFVEELQAAGIAACPKHFPGHGDTVVDSHAGLPVVDVDLATLRSRELAPFAVAVDAGARCVMTAHIVFPSLDRAPATLSAPVLSLLRDDLGFEGVIVSDAIDMQAISGTIGFGEGVVRALLAGVDLVGLGNPVLGKGDDPLDEQDFVEALDAVVTALEDGRLPLSRVTEAAGRVRSLSAWSLAQRSTPPQDSDLHDRDAAGIAARSLRTRGPVEGALAGPVQVLDIRRRRNIASGRLSGLLADTLVARLPGSRAASAFASAAVEGRLTGFDRAERVSDTDRVAALVQEQLGDPDVILTGTPGGDDEESALLDRLLERRPDAVVVCLGWSADDGDLTRARRAVFTFGDSRPTARAVTELLTAHR
jgi:beta-N-acetylhexosaminidase